VGGSGKMAKKEIREHYLLDLLVPCSIWRSQSLFEIVSHCPPFGPVQERTPAPPGKCIPGNCTDNENPRRLVPARTPLRTRGVAPKIELTINRDEYKIASCSMWVLSLFIVLIGYTPSTINLRLAGIRRLAYEAAHCGLLSPDLAAGIRRVKVQTQPIHESLKEQTYAS
jgi:hypothetical protein